MKVFVSWSGERSSEVAKALRKWLPKVIQAAKPYVSSQDTAVGNRWSVEISHELETTQFAILCLTPGNLDRPWVNFEAGAVSKSMQDGRVVPFLLDLAPTDLQGPLGQFHACPADEEGTRRLVGAINAALPEPLDETTLDAVFEAMWPQLETSLHEIEQDTPRSAAAPRSERELLEEVLSLVRDQGSLLAQNFPRATGLSGLVPAGATAVMRRRTASVLADRIKAMAGRSEQRIQDALDEITNALGEERRDAVHASAATIRYETESLARSCSALADAVMRVSGDPAPAGGWAELPLGDEA